jgi:hypothetical protein
MVKTLGITQGNLLAMEFSSSMLRERPIDEHYERVIQTYTIQEAYPMQLYSLRIATHAETIPDN